MKRIFATAGASCTIWAMLAGLACPSAIQGQKIDGEGNRFPRPSTISIRKPDQSWYGPSYGPRLNPFFFKNLPGGTYEVGIQVPDGYAASYSTCTNCISHPTSSWVQYQVPKPYSRPTMGYSPALVNVPEGGFIDLWWKFIKVDHPQNHIFDPATLNQTLTCNFPVMGILHTTNRRSIKGSNVGATVGIAGNFGGIATELSLQNLKSSDKRPLNIINAKSGAGSGWQTAIYGGDRPSDLIVIPNQAAGNSGSLQWGYAGTYSGLQQLDWNPLYSDHYSDINWSNNVGTTPCYGNAFRYSDGQSSIKTSLVSSSAGSVVRLMNSYTIRSRIAQSWSFFVIDQAVYMYRDMAKKHNLRIYFAKADRSHIGGPLSPADVSAFNLPTAETKRCDSPTDTYPRCEAQENNLSYALLVWTISGSDIGIAIHRTDNKPFNANAVLEHKAICTKPEDYSCGNLSIHSTMDSNFPEHGINPNFAVGDVRSYAFTYEIGMLDQLATLGYMTNATPHRGTIYNERLHTPDLW